MMENREQQSVNNGYFLRVVQWLQTGNVQVGYISHMDVETLLVELGPNTHNGFPDILMHT